MNEDLKPLFAAINTCEAGCWEILFAKLFGKKTVGNDAGCEVTVYHWRGKSYMTDCKKAEAH